MRIAALFCVVASSVYAIVPTVPPACSQPPSFDSIKGTATKLDVCPSLPDCPAPPPFATLQDSLSSAVYDNCFIIERDNPCFFNSPAYAVTREEYLKISNENLGDLGAIFKDIAASNGCEILARTCLCQKIKDTIEEECNTPPDLPFQGWSEGAYVSLILCYVPIRRSRKLGSSLAI